MELLSKVGATKRSVELLSKVEAKIEQAHAGERHTRVESEGEWNC